ncbi:hypothetical protein NDU88_009261 [Pleurodeles waltl]|uniref:Transient receptor potential cation channel subfamily M member 2 n=1 Tax=Pleurodeles waltl TaxID=8319 RepID=A0AAV7NYI7_PLEWA|nr:hypothetical protein NDU88_009261 [Pleurodeles waltl]
MDSYKVHSDEAYGPEELIKFHGLHLPESARSFTATKWRPRRNLYIPEVYVENKWFKEKIKKKECVHFVRNTDHSESSEEVCCCGNVKSRHVYDKPNITDLEWDEGKHIEEMATDAFGDFAFAGLRNKKAKYVRASNNTYATDLYDMMMNQWKLRMPNLLISVIGGAKDVKMNPRLKKRFSKGLLKAAQSTGAWIITDGCHTGVTKIVGEAVRDFSMGGNSCNNSEIVTIGITTWGTIHKRDSLIRTEKGVSAEYLLDVDHQGNLSCLDNNHSHFILVDDGKQGKYGVKIPLRTKLEKLICGETISKEEFNLKIPIVYLALEGGPGNLDIQDIVCNNQKFTILREDKNGIQDMDVAILQASLKAPQNMDPMGNVNWLKLAVLWNRLDIAKNCVFQSGWNWKPEDLYPMLTFGLIGNKPDFLQLFLDQGVSLQDYVTQKTLSQLYDNIEPHSIFHQKLKTLKKGDGNQGGDILHHVEQVLESLLWKFEKPPYSTKQPRDTRPQSSPSTNGESSPKMEYPIRDLLIWAVVQNRGELAKILWAQVRSASSSRL